MKRLLAVAVFVLGMAGGVARKVKSPPQSPAPLADAAGRQCSTNGPSVQPVRRRARQPFAARFLRAFTASSRSPDPFAFGRRGTHLRPGTIVGFAGHRRTARQLPLRRFQV